MKQELRACPNPWCSKSKPALTTGVDHKPFYEAYCDYCGARSPSKRTEAEAIAAWNSRPSHDRLVEALRACLERMERDGYHGDEVEEGRTALKESE